MEYLPLVVQEGKANRVPNKGLVLGFVVSIYIKPL